MQKHSLKVEKRDIVGKKVKKLRKSGVLPANIYGKDITSIAVQVPFKDFETVFKAAGETGLVELHLDGKTRPVLIHNVQLDYITQEPIHADFYQVNLKEKVKTMVQVKLIGQAQAVAEKLGLLMHTLSEIEVEALPTDLPESLDVDVTHLAAINDQITVGDIKKPAGVEILTDATQVIAKITALVSKEAEAQAAADAAAAAAKAAESATPAEGEAAATAATTGEKAEEKAPAAATAAKEEKK